MVNFNPLATTSSGMTGLVKDFSVSSLSTDGVSGDGETTYQWSDFTKYFGYYVEIPELKTAVDTKSFWTVGNGYEADNNTSSILDNITGSGVDTFNSILENLCTVSLINGDAFAEVVRSDEGVLVNLKPLDPSTIKVVYDEKGIIIRYEQHGKNKNLTKFKPREIFHLTYNRVADQTHGISVIDQCKWIIDARNEVMRDMRTLMHRHVKPMMKFMHDTDIQSEIDSLVSKYDQIVQKGENIHMPKGVTEHDIIAIPTNATLNPMPWIQYLHASFYQALGIPEIIIGGAQSYSESSSKIAYLAFEQSVKKEQLRIESQIWEQLQLRIKLTFPASLKNELLSDEAKDGELGQMNVQQNEVTAGVGR